MRWQFEILGLNQNYNKKLQTGGIVSQDQHLIGMVRHEL